jgi:hypothetical protein
VVERLLHTQEVAGSNPASRTILARRFSQEMIEDGAGKSRDELFPAVAGGFLLREKPIQQTHFACRLFTIFPGLGVLFFTIFVMAIS